MSDGASDPAVPETSVAIVGMAGRFPGAPDLTAFWANLRDGVESITSFSAAELRASGIGEDELADPSYVKAAAVIEGPLLFDADRFNYSRREAEFIDPQQRLFLECACEALESAGCDPSRTPGAIGVFAGAGTNTYQFGLVAEHGCELRSSAALQLLFMQGNDSDFLATRVSYKLGLRGPSLTVQTACSTSLVAVHLAVQSLLAGECDMALAGGISILHSYGKSGYRYEPGGIVSPDGHCRPFDAAARGTVFGDGVGIVALKRLDRALVDGDAIRAVIRGSAINNDGSAKVGYTAPGVDGQAGAIAEALAMAGVGAETIGYVEAHGTGTELGDPIEVRALTQAFRLSTEAQAFCALGSLKSNVGHLNVAAGIAGLIKAVLVLEHGTLVPSLHFRTPNPRIGFDGSPFYVNGRTAPWPRPGLRRAGVSSFGIGGTNAHVVLEQAPRHAASRSRRTRHVLLLSARTAAALDVMAGDLARFLRSHEDVNVADVAHTLASGRAAEKFVRAVVCGDSYDAARRLESRDPGASVAGMRSQRAAAVVFLFPGQGSQRVSMGRGAYAEEPAFRAALDRCAELLRDELGEDLRDVLFPYDDGAEATRRLSETALAQPAIFAVSYALVKMWEAWGVRPCAMIGHSVGELVAACLAGVFGLEDALRIVAVRGRLMQAMPPGGMTAVHAPLEDVADLLDGEVVVAARNGPAAWVAAGPLDSLTAFESRLRAVGIDSSRLRTSHAFHSPAMAPVVDPFVEFIGGIELRPPTLPFVSNVSGTWIDAHDACDPSYWGRQLAETVHFSAGIRTLAADGPAVFVEVGPGNALSTLTRAQLGGNEVHVASTLPVPDGGASEIEHFYRAAARAWIGGAPVAWERLYEGEFRTKVSLPAHPFERRRYSAGQAGLRALTAVAEVAGKVRDEPEPAEADAFVGGGAIAGSSVERVLCELWTELLGLERPVDRNDNFFALGGHSLLALRLLPRLTDAFGVELPLSTLFELPTVAELALRIEAVAEPAIAPAEEGEETHLVLLRAGSSPPLVLVHPIGGGLDCYAALIERLPPGPAVYGLHAFGRRFAAPPEPSIETVAAAYLRETARIRGAGPALLAGWSFGGVVAYEMARQLADSEGAGVALLALIDTYLPAGAAPLLDERALRDLFARYRFAEPGTGGMRLDEFANVDTAQAESVFAAFARHHRALYGYRVAPFGGRLHLFRAAESEALFEGWDSPWPELARGGCDVRGVPGTHFSLLERSNVGPLADLLGSALVAVRSHPGLHKGPRRSHEPIP
ncbi:MAG: phthiocerol/phenolphthiocerol synthesis type-I polyketide synthase [Candidatus Eremiobacteraeota bacterium]|nr:phthiocerol/phenolphthiocerol synthesis type-I polyketide synthase [Candidatus Eremiobacteraeota bacterium]